ncbi:LutC/YkgG family protein [Desulfosediminicola flagellatus]|uniref:LutC/YkgG family protein n=1 Tax=Desulfosediminicola flagellatus TaxID=2569541 RepID=UPI00142ED8AA|nr:lactate utilization protein [Desulfosediminicola flagellatus]
MTETTHLSRFMETARRVGANVTQLDGLQDVAAYVAANSTGKTLVPETALALQHNLKEILVSGGIDVYEGEFRKAGHFPGAGVTFSNFAMADTGTVVLESTMENVRLATTLPEKHFVVVDPETILEDNLAAAAPMTMMHTGSEPRFVAYVTGPSRTADIERVLTIGCHGPRELHILVIEGISSNLMEI